MPIAAQARRYLHVCDDVAACMYHTGYDPMTMRPVKAARALRDRRMQRALLSSSSGALDARRRRAERDLTEERSGDHIR